jgi:hypothetical protein
MAARSAYYPECVLCPQCNDVVLGRRPQLHEVKLTCQHCQLVFTFDGELWSGLVSLDEATNRWRITGL